MATSTSMTTTASILAPTLPPPPAPVAGLHDRPCAPTTLPPAIAIELASTSTSASAPASAHANTIPPTDPEAAGPESVPVSMPVQRWNGSRINICRLAAAFLSFAVMGANDAVYGALIPYWEPYYHLTHTIVSLVFLAPLAGYALSATVNSAIHLALGQRGVAVLGPASHAISYAIACRHPPFAVLLVAGALAGFGNGVLDAAWNAWVGDMAPANELLGLLHACYGLGATVGPWVATALVARAHAPWYAFYYLMVGAALVELAVSLPAFWRATAATFRQAHPRSTTRRRGRMREALAHRVTWTLSLFLLGYVGVEVALGGWIVTFMMRVRKSDPYASGISAVGFWLGITLGRVVLGFVTGRMGAKLAISIYFLCAMALLLLFWLVPAFIVSAVAVALLGFFLGPLFPAAVMAATTLLPKELHIGAIGFAAACGGAGSAFFPFAVGAIAQARGVQVLPPIVLAWLVAILALWLSLPRLGEHSHQS